MRLDLGGQPIHTRALSVVVEHTQPDGLRASVDLVDLRKRGFAPVGSELQGAGIIHQMGLDARIERGELADLQVRQPVVAFEASAATRGESCRDVVPALAALVGRPLSDAAHDVRGIMGGAAGCSHLLAAAQYLFATLAACGPLPRFAPSAAHRRLLRRDLILDGHERDDGALLIGVQLADLRSGAAEAEDRPGARFERHDELRLRLELHGWPATIGAIAGAERTRTRADFAAAAWRDLEAALAPLAGTSLGKGAAQRLSAQLASHAAARDALLQLGPALIQCRAAFPDKWQNAALASAEHDGLIGMPDSCYMWRRDGALARIRAARSGA
jgi:hypothetical protein